MTTFGEPWFVKEETSWGHVIKSQEQYHNGMTGKTENRYIAFNLRKNHAERIISCVNACSGLNPDAVPELVEACKDANAWILSHAELDKDSSGIAVSDILESALERLQGGK